MRALAIILASALGMFAGSGRSPASALADEAYDTYIAGDFDQARQKWQDAADASPAVGGLWYNLGNAYFRLGQPGEAVAAYLAARSALPRDPDISANLSHVLSKIPDRLDAEHRTLLHSLAFWYGWATVAEWWTWATFIWIATVGLGLWNRSSPLPRGFWIGLLAGTLLAVAGLVQASLEEVWGAVIVPTAPVRSSPGSQGVVLFELHEGAPIMVRSAAQESLAIVLSDSKTGWIDRHQVRVHIDAFESHMLSKVDGYKLPQATP